MSRAVLVVNVIHQGAVFARKNTSAAPSRAALLHSQEGMQCNTTLRPGQLDVRSGRLSPHASRVLSSRRVPSRSLPGAAERAQVASSAVWSCLSFDFREAKGLLVVIDISVGNLPARGCRLLLALRLEVFKAGAVRGRARYSFRTL